MSREDQEISLSLSMFDFGKHPTILSLIKQACKDKKFEVVKYILNQYVPIEPIDDNGDTILHFIIKHLEEMGGITFLQLILSKPEIEKIINKVSKRDGFTPAFLAGTLKLDRVINMLVSAGADLKIPSQSGSILVTDTAPTETVPIKNDKPLSIVTSIADTMSKFFAPLLENRNMPSTETTLDMTSHPQYLYQQGGSSSGLSTEAFVEGVWNDTLNKPNNSKFTGGSRSIVNGSRYMNQAPEYTSSSSIVGGRKKHDAQKAVKKGSIELGRITDDIHNRTIETIKTLMGVDDDTAKVYKSVLYYRVKEEHPEASSYERAIEMEKMATKSTLKSIDIDDARRKREEAFELRKSSQSSDEKPKRKKKTEIVSDSSEKSEKKQTKRKKRESETSRMTTTSSPILDTDLSSS